MKPQAANDYYCCFHSPDKVVPAAAAIYRT